MSKERKLRSDAKLAAIDRVLSDAERLELQRLARIGSLATLQIFFENHGISLSVAGASRTAARLRQAGDRLMKNREAIDALRAAAATRGETLNQAALDQAALALTDVLDAAADPTSIEGQKLLLAALPVLTGVRNSEISADRVKAGREALALAERKLKLLEEKEAKAKAVVSDSKLTAGEQAKRLREIFAK